MAGAIGAAANVTERDPYGVSLVDPPAARSTTPLASPAPGGPATGTRLHPRARALARATESGCGAGARAGLLSRDHRVRRLGERYCTLSRIRSRDGGHLRHRATSASGRARRPQHLSDFHGRRSGYQPSTLGWRSSGVSHPKRRLHTPITFRSPGESAPWCIPMHRGAQ